MGAGCGCPGGCPTEEEVAYILTVASINPQGVSSLSIVMVTEVCEDGDQLVPPEIRLGEQCIPLESVG